MSDTILLCKNCGWQGPEEDLETEVATVTKVREVIRHPSPEDPADFGEYRTEEVPIKSFPVCPECDAPGKSTFRKLPKAQVEGSHE